MNKYIAAEACNYLDNGNPDALVAFLELEEFTTFETNNVMCAHGIHASVDYLIFRSTFSSAGWLLDLDFIPTKWEGPGLIHQGFEEAFVEFDHWFKYSLDKPLYVMGHSLGGALATLATFKYPSVKTITFGQPPVGDMAFVNGFKHVVERYVNDLDPIPYLGPFEHTNSPIELGGFLFSSLLKHIWTGLPATLVRALNDHYMASYLEAINAS